MDLLFHIFSPSQVFPNYLVNSRPISHNSALAKIKAKRAAAKQAAALHNHNTNTNA